MGDTVGAGTRRRAQAHRLVRVRQLAVAQFLGLVLVHLFQPGVGARTCHLPPVTRPRTGIDRASTFDTSADFITHIVPSIDGRRARQERGTADRRACRSVRGGSDHRRRRKCRGTDRQARSMRWSHVMLQITNYVMRVAPFAVFAAVAATLDRARAESDRRPRLFHGHILHRAADCCGRFCLIGRCLRCFMGGRTHVRPDPVCPRTACWSLFRPLRRRRPIRACWRRSTGSASHRKIASFRPAARLFVQPRRVDDVHDVRVAVHRPGVWDRHVLGIGEQITMLLVLMVTSKGIAARAARLAGGDRRRPCRCSTSRRSRRAVDPGRRPFPRHGPHRHQRDRQCRRQPAVVAKWEGGFDAARADVDILSRPHAPSGTGPRTVAVDSFDDIGGAGR